MNRRKFLSMFAAGAVGMTVVDKLGFLEELKNWVLSPQKTIFLPPEPKVWTWAADPSISWVTYGGGTYGGGTAKMFMIEMNATFDANTGLWETADKKFVKGPVRELQQFKIWAGEKE